jgi:predicted pyridoxine 5'-phosphate oxidase superfamily flavin-nucleotide-binding protein
LCAITGPSEIAFPDYDGNGMFKSLGNIVANADVGLLFIAMHDKPQRLRVNGSASVSDNDPLLARLVGAQLIVSRDRARDLSELSALHSRLWLDRAVDLCTRCRTGRTGAGVEGLC